MGVYPPRQVGLRERRWVGGLDWVYLLLFQGWLGVYDNRGGKASKQEEAKKDKTMGRKTWGEIDVTCTFFGGRRRRRKRV